MGADISQSMAILFAVLFIVGWFQARNHKGHRHHWLMISATLTMLGFFTSYYLFRQLGVLAFEGRTGFGGPQPLYDNVFMPLLRVHIILVIVGLVMAVHLVVLGFRAQVLVGGRRILGEIRLITPWFRVATTFGFAAGLVALLFISRAVTSGFSGRKAAVYIGLLILIALVFAAELMIQRTWPDGRRRHRVLGRITMMIYLALAVTGSLTYTMLYVLYPGEIG